jgi:CheY-like chemotaxis protein
LNDSINLYQQGLPHRSGRANITKGHIRRLRYDPRLPLVTAFFVLMNLVTQPSTDSPPAENELPVAVGHLAHDLNNTLLPLMMGLELLKSPMSDPDRTEIIDLLKLSTLRVEEISKKMLNLTQPDPAEPWIPSTSPSTSGPPPSTTTIPRAQGQLVLVIDDEPMILGVIRHILESHGYSVLTASGGNEGCELYQRHLDQTALVIVDMFMPLISGHETIKKLIGIDARVCIIAISGQSGEMFGPDFLNNNVRGFLHKPFTSYTLLKTVDMLVHG